MPRAPQLVVGSASLTQIATLAALLSVLYNVFTSTGTKADEQRLWDAMRRGNAEAIQTCREEIKFALHNGGKRE